MTQRCLPDMLAEYSSADRLLGCVDGVWVCKLFQHWWNHLPYIYTATIISELWRNNGIFCWKTKMMTSNVLKIRLQYYFRKETNRHPSNTKTRRGLWISTGGFLWAHLWATLNFFENLSAMLRSSDLSFPGIRCFPHRLAEAPGVSISGLLTLPVTHCAGSPQWLQHTLQREGFPRSSKWSPEKHRKVGNEVLLGAQPATFDWISKLKYLLDFEEFLASSKGLYWQPFM